MNRTKSISRRSILINQKNISYKLRRSVKAKYLRMQIANSELEVVLPRGCSISEAEKFIIKKSNWIDKYLLKEKTRNKEEKFFLFGEKINILQTFDFFSKNHKINFNNNVLNIVSPAQSKTDLSFLYMLWLKNYSKKYIPVRTRVLSDKYNFKINKVTIRGQKTRWGSCSSKGNLSFNFKLMQFKKEIIDYVIIHELCHLKEMNHSKRFWNLVEIYCPNYKYLRKELKVPIT